MFSVSLGFRQNVRLPYKSLLYFIISDCANPIEAILDVTRIYSTDDNNTD